MRKIKLNKLYEKYINNFNILKKVANHYEIDDSNINKFIDEIQNFKVTVPLIGGFSTGKSTLINKLINHKLLPTKITPETAIPTEISYGDNEVYYDFDNSRKKISIDTFVNNKFFIEHTKIINIKYNNDFLSKIPSIKIVDMPGFDSGCEVHNRSINNYLPSSLAYIITISADEGTLRESIINFLKELKINEMPVYVVVTKSDKVMKSELELIVKHIKEEVQKYLEIDNVTIGCVSSVNNEIDYFKEILLSIQDKSESIFCKEYDSKLNMELSIINKYLLDMINKKDYTEEEITEEKNGLEESLKNFNDSLEKKKDKFEKQAAKSVVEINEKVIRELSNNSPMLENMLIQGNDISERINYIVRNAVSLGIKNNFTPKVRKYISDVEEMIDTSIFKGSIELLDKATIDANEEMKSSLKNAITPITTAVVAILGNIGAPVIASTLGLTISSAVLGPIGIAAGVLVGAFLGNAIDKKMHQKEERQKREMAKKKISEIIDTVSNDVKIKIEKIIREIIDKVNTVIEDDINQKIAFNRKIIEDLEAKLKQTEKERKEKLEKVTNDLNLLKNISKDY